MTFLSGFGLVNLDKKPNFSLIKKDKNDKISDPDEI